jgi:hypothetical protein
MIAPFSMTIGEWRELTFFLSNALPRGWRPIIGAIHVMAHRINCSRLRRHFVNSSKFFLTAAFVFHHPTHLSCFTETLMHCFWFYHTLFLPFAYALSMPLWLFIFSFHPLLVINIITYFYVELLFDLFAIERHICGNSVPPAPPA